MRKNLFQIVALVAMSLVTLFTSCKKEKIETDNALTNVEAIITSSFDDGERGICKPMVKPVADYPRCVKELFNDPEYEIWDFAHMEQPHNFDTADYKSFLIPPKDEFMAGWNKLLILTEKDPYTHQDTIAMRFVVSFPLDWEFNPIWYYETGADVYIEFLSYDFEELFCSCIWNIKVDDFWFYTRGCSGRGKWDPLNPEFSGFEVIEYLPLDELIHSRDFNRCEIATYVAEGILELGAIPAGILTGGVGAAIFSVFNGLGWAHIRRHVCRG